MNDKIYLTEEGKQKLVERLEFLTKTEMPQIVERIKVAREQGDLSENAEYAAAREEQARVDGEIKEIEAQLKLAIVYSNENRKKGVVSIGSKVRVIDYADGGDGMEAVYQIVGTAEANIRENKITNESPIGKSLIGKKVGDTVTVNAPIGNYEIKIVEILA
ncbi:MAG: transcription elongation factor GreA [Christensenellaceae bacterium]